MVNQSCSIATCNQSACSRGWCQTHYMRWYRHGTTTLQVHICKEESCNNKHYARGWCSKHWKRWWKYGNPAAGHDRQVSSWAGIICSILDCDNNAYARGWCEMHYMRWVRNGDVLTRRCVANGEYKGGCLIEGCPKERICRGMCAPHYDKNLRLERHKSPEAVRAAVYRRRARKSGSSDNSLSTAGWPYMQSLFGHLCVYCRQRVDTLEQDHIIPLSRGGTHTSDNVVPACRTCNSKKYTKTASEFMND